MTFMEVVLNAWTCDNCEIEILAEDDGLPKGWIVDMTGDSHLCGACASKVAMVLVRTAAAS